MYMDHVTFYLINVHFHFGNIGKTKKVQQKVDAMPSVCPCDLFSLLLSFLLTFIIIIISIRKKSMPTYNTLLFLVFVCLLVLSFQ